MLGPVLEAIKAWIVDVPLKDTIVISDTDTGIYYYRDSIFLGMNYTEMFILSLYIYNT